MQPSGSGNPQVGSQSTEEEAGFELADAAKAKTATATPAFMIFSLLILPSSLDKKEDTFFLKTDMELEQFQVGEDFLFLIFKHIIIVIMELVLVEEQRQGEIL